jgi:hypothetical protein
LVITFDVSLLGQHAKTESIITDENVQNILRKHLREMKDENRTPSNFCEDLNGFLLQSLPNSPPSVSVETARRWMIFLKFNATKASKGWFTDGHERVDVVQYRTTFLQKMESLERRMKRFGRDKAAEMETVEEPDLLPGEKEVVLITHDVITHDESTFYCNEEETFLDGE